MVYNVIFVDINPGSRDINARMFNWFLFTNITRKFFCLILLYIIIPTHDLHPDIDMEIYILGLGNYLYRFISLYLAIVNTLQEI